MAVNQYFRTPQYFEHFQEKIDKKQHFSLKNERNTEGYPDLGNLKNFLNLKYQQVAISIKTVQSVADASKYGR